MLLHRQVLLRRHLHFLVILDVDPVLRQLHRRFPHRSGDGIRPDGAIRSSDIGLVQGVAAGVSDLLRNLVGEPDGHFQHLYLLVCFEGDGGFCTGLKRAASGFRPVSIQNLV